MSAPTLVPERNEVDVPADLATEIEGYMARYPDFHSAALPALEAAQRRHGWCSPDAILQVAAVMRVTPAYLESVASFYDMLRLEPAGRHTILACTNLSCQLRGAREVLEAFERATGAGRGGMSPDGEFQLEAFECLGACDQAPMASVDDRYLGPLLPEDAEAIVADLRDGREPLPGKRFVGDLGRKAAR